MPTVPAPRPPMNASPSIERRWLVDVLRVLARELEAQRPGESRTSPLVRHLASLAAAAPGHVSDDWEAVAQVVFREVWGRLSESA